MFGEFPSRALHQSKPGPFGNDRVIQSSGTASAQNGGALSDLITQARGLINEASAAKAASRREPPSATTAMLARIIVSELRNSVPTISYFKVSTWMGRFPIGTTSYR